MIEKKRTIEGRKKGGGRRKTDVAVTLSLKTCQGTSHESKVPKSFTSSCPICLFFLVTCCVLLVNKTRFNNGAANSCDYCSGKSLPDIHIGRGRLVDDGGKTDRPAGRRSERPVGTVPPIFQHILYLSPRKLRIWLRTLCVIFSSSLGLFSPRSRRGHHLLRDGPWDPELGYECNMGAALGSSSFRRPDRSLCPPWLWPLKTDGSQFRPSWRRHPETCCCAAIYADIIYLRGYWTQKTIQSLVAGPGFKMALAFLESIIGKCSVNFG